MKTLLILNAGVEAIPGIIVAKKMGCRVVVCDKNIQAPGFKYADHKIVESIYQPINLLIKLATLTLRSEKLMALLQFRPIHH